MNSPLPVAATGVSVDSDVNSDGKHYIEPSSPLCILEEEGELSDLDCVKEEDLDQELSEEANYRVTIRGVQSFLGWHLMLEFDSSSSSPDNNPFAGTRSPDRQSLRQAAIR